MTRTERVSPVVHVLLWFVDRVGHTWVPEEAERLEGGRGGEELVHERLEVVNLASG